MIHLIRNVMREVSAVWGVSPLEDYLKFKGMTVIGVLLYPIIAPIILLMLVYAILENPKKLFKKKRK